MADNNQPKVLRLPLSVAQPADIGRVLRELSLIDEHLRQEGIRQPTKRITVKTSDKLGDLIEHNAIDITDPQPRAGLINWLENLKKAAPIVNVSFGSEASKAFILKTTQWFRKEIDPNCLIIVGLDPSIGVGSIVRTNNKAFDLSLKNHLKSTRALLLGQIQRYNQSAGPVNEIS